MIQLKCSASVKKYYKLRKITKQFVKLQYTTNNYLKSLTLTNEFTTIQYKTKGLLKINENSRRVKQKCGVNLNNCGK